MEPPDTLAPRAGISLPFMKTDFVYFLLRSGSVFDVEEMGIYELIR